MDLWELWGTTCINDTLQRLQENPCSSIWSTFFHSFCSAHSVCGVISLGYSHSSPSAVQVFLPLNMVFKYSKKLSQRCHQLAWFAQLCPVVGLSWSQLELSPSDMEATSDLFLEKSPLQPSLLLKICFVTKIKMCVLIKLNWSMHILKYFTEPAEVKPMRSDSSLNIKTVYILIWCYHSGARKFSYGHMLFCSIYSFRLKKKSV